VLAELKVEKGETTKVGRKENTSAAMKDEKRDNAVVVL
jgi:hypothetical protein